MVLSQILTALETVLENIRQANGYNTDAGYHISVERIAGYNDRDEMFVNILSGGSDIEEDEAAIGTNIHVQEIFVVVGAVGDASLTATRQMAEDVLAAIGTVRTLDGLVDGIDYLGLARPDIEQGEKIVASRAVRLAVRYTTDIWGL